MFEIVGIMFCTVSEYCKSAITAGAERQFRYKGDLYLFSPYSSVSSRSRFLIGLVAVNLPKKSSSFVPARSQEALEKGDESENVDLNINLHKGTPDNITFEILWDDEYKVNDSHIQAVNLN